MNLWSQGRADAVDGYDAQRGLARLLSRLGLATARVPVCAGRYEIVELTGAGGFGRVYRGRDPELDREVALKAIPVSTAGAAEARRLARAEAQIMARLSHPNIIEVFDVFVAPSPDPDVNEKGESDLFIVMPFIRGDTLADWVRGAAPSAEVILDAYLQAARGLAAAHKHNLVHRDFKPANAMRNADGRVVVLDFGVATACAAAGVDVGGHALPDGVPEDVTARSVRARRQGGTPAYMAPEQHEARPVTTATDVYAFGVSLYEALVGRRPFQADSMEALWYAKKSGLGNTRTPPALPASLYRVIRRAVEPDPADRWPSMDAMLVALEGRGRRRRGGLAVATWTLIVGAGIGALAAAPDGSQAECRSEGTTMLERWEGTRESLKQSLVDASVPPARRVPFVAHADAFADEWAVALGRWCEHDRSPRVRECLAAADRAIWARIDAALTSPDGAAAAVMHRDLWPVVAACNDDELVRQQPLPDGPDALARIDALHTWVAAPGDPPPSELEVRIEEARSLGHAPTLAKVLIASATVSAARNEDDLSIRQLEAAYTAASEGGADRLALAAATSIIGLVAHHAPLQTAQRWAASAFSLCDRLQATERNRATTHLNLALSFANAEQLGEAREHAEQALAYARTAPPSQDHFGIRANLVAAMVTSQSGDSEIAVRYSEQALERARTLFPDDLAQLNQIAATLAVAYRRVGREAESEALLQDIIDSERSTQSDRWRAAANLILLLKAQGRVDAALALIDRLVVAGDPPVDPAYGNLLASRGTIHQQRGDADAARTSFLAARRIYVETLPAGHIWIAMVDRHLDELNAPPP